MSLQAAVAGSVPLSKTARGITTDTASDHSGTHEVIEYDVNNNIIQISNDSPAAAALKANAEIKVSRAGKAARAVHMQTVRKLVKRATGTTKSGVLRGKPPRLPPQANEVVPKLDRIEEEDDDEVLLSEEVILPDDVVPGTAAAGKKVLDEVDSHDLLKLLRWRSKSKSDIDEVKKPKSYAKGKVIDGQHELYTLSIAVMIGVRTSISRTNTELNSTPTDHPRWVRPSDFTATEKYEFRPKGGSLTPPHMLAHTFKFKDYAPVAFSYLRRMFGINEFDFLLSVCGNANFIEFISNAKSGQFFFYSSDGRYMIKTMTNAEILPTYFKHCAENPNTMITRFFGMYRVKLYHLRRNVKFVIMNSVYHTDKYLQTFFDLKGSVLGRDAKPGQAVLKDNDIRRQLPGASLALKQEQRDLVREQLDADCKYLQKMEIMDFSMLVGVHHVPFREERDMNSISTLGFRPRINGTASYDVEESDHSVESPVKSPMDVGDDGLNVRSNSSDRTRRLSEQIGDFFYDNGLDDDDGSYLEGHEENLEEAPRSMNLETEKKKQATVEKLYWPFHHLFDIHGHRRLKPVTCAKCDASICECNVDDRKQLKGYNIPQFVPPLSHRKDGGFELDTTGQKMPMVFKGPKGDQKYEGKVFYMGIIDILQEYNSRKAIEASYRFFTSSRNQASCVNPRAYSERFVHFFNEYTESLPIAGKKKTKRLVARKTAGRRNSSAELGNGPNMTKGRRNSSAELLKPPPTRRNSSAEVQKPGAAKDSARK